MTWSVVTLPAGEEVVRNLVLVEAAWLPTGWGSRVAIREYFEQFCQVSTRGHHF